MAGVSVGNGNRFSAEGHLRAAVAEEFSGCVAVRFATIAGDEQGRSRALSRVKREVGMNVQPKLVSAVDVDLSARVIGRAKWFLGRMSSERAPKECTVGGRRFFVERGVFSPAYSRSTEFFADFLSKRCCGKTVFEVGCGSGSIAVLCALGGAKRVVCTDVNEAAVHCAKKNAKRHGVDRIVEVIHERTFDAVQDRFDIVFFALPYVFVEDAGPFVLRYGELAYSVFDEGYRSQREFLLGAPKMVKGDGVIYVGFSQLGELDKFNRNVTEIGAVSLLVARAKEGRADNRIYEIVTDVWSGGSASAASKPAK